MRILVVCGAGASSTFVAQRLRRASADQGFAWQVEAGTERTLRAGTDAALVLLGSHLSDHLGALRAELDPRVPLILMPEDIFTDLDGSRTLHLVRDAMAAPQEQKETP